MGVLPTSDKQGVPSESNVPQTGAEVNETESAAVKAFQNDIQNLLDRFHKGDIERKEALSETDQLRAKLLNAKGDGRIAADKLDALYDQLKAARKEIKHNYGTQKSAATQEEAANETTNPQDAPKPYQDVIDTIMKQWRTKKITDAQAEKELKEVMMDAKRAFNNKFDDMKVVKGQTDTLNAAELSAIEKNANMAIVDEIHEEQRRKRETRKARKEEGQKKSAPKANENPIFGSVEDADKHLWETMGISQDEAVVDVGTVVKNATDEEVERLKAELSKEFNKLSANPLFNPRIYTLSAKLGFIYLQRGYNTFKKWAAKMRAECGADIEPWQGAIWETIKAWPKDVAFKEEQVEAFSRAVGARYESGMTDKKDIIADLTKNLSPANKKTFTPFIEASYNGVKKFFDDRSTKGANGNVHGNAGTVAARDSQGNHQNEVGRNDEGGEPAGRNGQAGGNTAGGQEEQLQGRDGVPESGAAAGRKAGDSGVQAEKSDDRSSRAGSAELPRGVRDGYEGLPDDAGRGSEDTVAAAERGRHDETAATPKPNKRVEQIRKEMPWLLPEQAEDVDFAETRLLDNDKTGVMFTNGTGTGKTYTGMGIAKRFYSQGKKNILVIAPSNDIIKQWIDAAKKDFAMPLTQLTGKQDAGEGPVITTFANIGDNDAVMKRHWDAILVDESHTLMNSEGGNLTKPLKALRALSRHLEGFNRYMEALHKDEQSAVEKALSDWKAAMNHKAKNAAELGAKYEEIKKQYDAIKEQEEQNYQGDEKAKVVFLSATPFAYVADVDYANGYLFDYGSKKAGNYNEADARDQFFIDHFGYRMRYNKLTKPDADVDNSVMERQFHDWLEKSGALHGRVLTSNYDYDRGFLLVDGGIGKKIDEGMSWLWNNKAYWDLAEFIRKRYDYHSRMYLLEAIKAKESIPIIQEYVKRGKKVVVFHDYKKGGGIHPFRLTEEELRKAYDPAHPGRNASVKKQYEAFVKARPDLVQLDMGDLKPPVQLFAETFGDTVGIYNGDVSKKDRTKVKNDFNDDNGKMKVILVQSDAGQAGISLHDTTGKYQRVLINLGLPVKPVAAIQQEGRIYRVGNKSNAVFRYLNTGTNMEQMAFATKIAERASTAENLALGEQARSLKQSYIQAFNESQEGESWKQYLPGSETEGTGGKAADYDAKNTLSDWDRAKSFYFGQEKKNSRSKAREGVDYFATPEPLGLKMVEWAGLKAGESALEPSAGHGAIARWLPENTKNTVIEPSGDLIPKLIMSVPNADAKQTMFESLDLHNKYDGIVMNPPFGKGGKTAIDHLAKAFKHLNGGGRIVAIIPDGPSCQKHFDKWLYGDPDAKRQEDRGEKYAALRAEIKLPGVTFSRAGTNVSTKVVIIDKYWSQSDRDLANADTLETSIEAGNVKELFNTLENMTVPDRISDTAAYDTNKAADDIAKSVFDKINSMSRWGKPRRYSVYDAEKATRRTMESVKEEIKSAFPNAKNITEDGSRLTFTMPNGKKITVDVKQQIAVTDEELQNAKKAHGYDEDGDVVVEGFAKTHGKDAYIALSEGSREGTGYHEAFHVARDMVLTAYEKAVLDKAFKGDEEAQADAYAEWVQARKQQRGTAWGKLWQKIRDIARKIQQFFTRTENASDVMKRIESGSVWNRKAESTPKEQRSLYENNNVIPFSDLNRLKNFVRLALKSVNNPIRITLGKVSKEEAAAIQDATGLNVEGYEHVWHSNDVRHTNNRHGEGREKNKKQIGLTAEEIAEAVRIIKSPEKIKKGTPTDEGLPSIRYIKTQQDGTLTVVEVVKDTKKQLFVKTIWKRKPDKHHANTGLLDTSETAAGKSSSTTSSITQKNGDSNPEIKFSIRKQNEDEFADVVAPQDIIDAINDIVPIYEKSSVKPGAKADVLYNAKAGAGFSGSYFNLNQYGRILAMHLDSKLKLTNNQELTKKMQEQYANEKAWAGEMFTKGDKEGLTPAEARREPKVRAIWFDNFFYSFFLRHKMLFPGLL